MKWGTLLTDFRCGRESQYKRERHRPPWQLDMDRITFSSAFRRLQDKTQVFPLSSSDYVRTRLTHSMEVAAVGRSLGNLVGFSLEERKVLGEVHPLEIGMIVSAATLAHDIGNPPFGHSGEDAIRNWFRKSRTVDIFRGELSPAQISDFENYEGNAQGFRVLGQLQMYGNQGGMQLTAATMAAFSKYPAQSPPLNGVKRSHDGQSTKKFGLFQADLELFRQIAEVTGLPQRSSEDQCWVRHPLAFLVEAADDICYRIVDLEDSFRQNLVTYEEVEHLLEPVINSKTKMERVRKEGERDTRVDIMRSQAIGEAIDRVSEAFQENYNGIMDGTFDRSLLSTTRVEPHFWAIKDVQAVRVYKNARVLRVEATGFRVLGGLLEMFTTAAFDAHRSIVAESPFSAESEKLFDLIPRQFIGPDRKPDADPYIRLLRILDYVCGMTDSYALTLYRNMSGISLP